MKIIAIFTLTILVIFTTHIYGAVYDVRYDYTRKSFDDPIFKSPIKRDYLNDDDYKYRDPLYRENLEDRDNFYERIRLERMKKLPYGYYSRDRNIPGRDILHDRRDHWDHNRRHDSEYENARYIRRQSPHQFWQNGKKYEIINGKTFEVFNVGSY